MNFDADKKTISTLLNSKKKFEIPRFQREYSWEKSQLEEFFNDIVSRITVDSNSNLITTEYFWGSTLFVGNFTDANCRSMQVVDGQQRLTTITIYLSCIRRSFLKIGKPTLAKLTQAYIMSTNDNGEEYAILVNETPYPYFQNTVQAEEEKTDSAISDEEKNIKNAVDYFTSRLAEKKIVKYFYDKFNKKFDISDIYKALRDQLLNSVIIAISTQDKHQANMIFEILNAKGKSLDQIDLIKNQIFSVVTKEQPSDEAKTLWSNIKNTLYSRESSVDMAVFFNHYWTCKYGRTTYKNLYKKFKSTIKNKECIYLEFLNDLAKNAEYYVKITNPSTADFNNRVEYRKVYYYLTFLNDINIRQSRIIILALFELINRNPRLLSCTELNRCLENLCSFHLIYNGLFSQRTNVLDKLYSTAAIRLCQIDDKADLNSYLNDLYIEMGKYLQKVVISKESLQERFNQLKYSKSHIPDNVKSKFFLRLIYEIGSAYPTDASIEHIANESSGLDGCLNIGNLIPLEQKINSQIPDSADFKYKLQTYYSQSHYYMVNEFVNLYKNQAWSSNSIKERGLDMVNLFITNYLKDFKLTI